MFTGTAISKANDGKILFERYGMTKQRLIVNIANVILIMQIQLFTHLK